LKNFNQKFNSYTKDSYPFVKLKDIVCNVRYKTIEVLMLFREGSEKELELNKTAIEQAIKKTLGTNAELSIKFIKSHFDANHFKAEFVEFCSRFPLLFTQLKKDDILVNSDDLSVSVLVDELTYDYCQEKNIPSAVEEFLDRHYFVDVGFAFIKKEGASEIDDSLGVAPQTHLEYAGGRYIVPKNIDALIGRPIYSRASYIEDAVSATQELTVCGTLDEFSTIEYKDKNTGEAKKFYKLRVRDFTGTIEALFFPHKKSPDKITLLKQGKEIAIRGSLEPNIKNRSVLSFKARDISYCTLPTDFKLNRIILPVDTHYRTVFPTAYIETAQGSLFEDHKAVASNFKGKTYVVFDTETTGTNSTSDKIIEIGALKIVDGKFTETFSSLVDPRVPIPAGASAVNNIYDADVAGQPTIDLVLADFYKFVEGSTLVAHNMPFDQGFIEAAGRPLGIYFEHEKLDTLYLSRKYFKHLTHHNLPFLTKHFNITHVSKHRAVDDSIACAKLLEKIFEHMDD